MDKKSTDSSKVIYTLEMNKITQLSLGFLALIIIGGIVYVVTSKNVPNIPKNSQVMPPQVASPKAPKASDTTVPVPNQAPRANTDPITPAPAPAGMTEMGKRNSLLNYTCKDGKTFSLSFASATNSTTTLTLNNAGGKRTLEVTPKVVGKDPALENEKSGVAFINKGNYALITEGGKTTFDECKL